MVIDLYCFSVLYYSGNDTSYKNDVIVICVEDRENPLYGQIWTFSKIYVATKTAGLKYVSRSHVSQSLKL